MSRMPRVADYVIPATDTVCPTDPVARVRQLMKSRELRSVIVAHKDKPVGVIRWGDVGWMSDGVGHLTAREIMRGDCPVLCRDVPVSVARERLAASSLDWAPVVDSDGNLVGVVSSEALMRLTPPSEPTAPHAQPAVWRIRRAFNIRPGMNVYASDGVKLGLVDRMFLDGGTISDLLMTYGRPGRQHARLPFDLVDHLEEETIILGIDAAHFSHFIGNDS